MGICAKLNERFVCAWLSGRSRRLLNMHFVVSVLKHFVSQTRSRRAIRAFHAASEVAACDVACRARVRNMKRLEPLYRSMQAIWC